MPPPHSSPQTPAGAGTEFPQKFGKYVLLRKLARGGMAEIFLARKADSPKLYVIKRILPAMARDKSFLSMFLTEAKVAAQLDHPNIIRIDALGREGPHLYLAMEYVDGIDLERLLKACGGKLPPDLMTQIGMDLCDALCFANRSKDINTGVPLNVVHRDVTPGNVMISRQGTVKLVDFGVAKATAQAMEQTRAGVVKGKFRYMSPEQVQLKPLDGRSDLFSVGVLLYEATTAVRPFDHSNPIQVITKLTTLDPTPPAKLIKGYPKAVSDVIMKALTKDRDRRYADGYEMKAALAKALSSIGGGQDLRSFVAQYLPPPLDIPPFVPPARRSAQPSPSSPRQNSADGGAPERAARNSGRYRQAAGASDEFGDWDAPEADINAPDPDDPRKGAPAHNLAPSHAAREALRRDSASAAGRAQASSGSGSRPAQGVSSDRVPGARYANSPQQGRGGGQSSPSSTSLKRRNSVGLWSKKEAVVPAPSAKDHDDSWKVSDKSLRNFTRDAGDTGAILADSGGKPEGSSSTLRNAAILIVVLAVAAVVFAYVPGLSSLFGSDEGGGASGTGKITVTSVLGMTGAVLINGERCELPCTRSVPVGKTIDVANAQTPSKKLPVVLSEQGETRSLTLESL